MKREKKLEKIKKIMPAGITAVGIIISVSLIFLSRFTGQGYQALITSELMCESAMVVLAECLGSAAAFNILLKKEKSSDHGFPQT